MRTLLPSLEFLAVGECPELESFTKGGLPLNLEILSLWDCDKLFSRRMGWGLPRSGNFVFINYKCTIKLGVFCIPFQKFGFFSYGTFDLGSVNIF